MSPTITVLLDLPPASAFHRATLAALDHAIEASGRALAVRVAGTDAFAGRDDARFGAGVVIGPGSPYRDPNAAEDVIRVARERGVPLVGT